MTRVKFYSIHDLACGYNLKKSEKLLKDYEEGKENLDINDHIEIYNVKKYFDNQIYLKEWGANTIEHYKNIIKTNFKKVAKYFNSINENNFNELYSSVDKEYTQDFWELIEKFKVYENISEEKFKEFLNMSKVWLFELLRCKKIVQYFGKIIREYMLNDSTSAELLLDEYEMKDTRKRKPLYFPIELSSSDKEQILMNYINSSAPNLNYLRLIANIQSNKDKIVVSPKTLLYAKKKIEELEKELFPENSGLYMETIVGFSKTQDEVACVELKNQSLKAIYSSKWIEENLDYATLLNNFIYLFEFVDWQMRSLHVSKFNDLSVFERYLITTSRNAYTKGLAFDQNDVLSLLQITAYYNELFSNGIRLEEVIEWFFEEYLYNEFEVKGFIVIMPSEQSTILEKCTNIMPALESVLKQFTLYVKEGKIDYELLEIRAEQLIFKNIPSLINKKYVYGVGSEYKVVTNLLFSDQSGLNYNEKTGKSYKNFYDLLRNEKVRLWDFPKYHQEQINWLIENGYLAIDLDGYINIHDKLLVNILKDLYFNEVVSYWKYPYYGRKVIDELEKKNLIEFESTLFSRPEQDYFNYFLNKSKFNNGLDLRNKYSHTQPFYKSDEKIHFQNYMIFLRLFILTVIKINDEYCTVDDMGTSMDKMYFASEK